MARVDIEILAVFAPSHDRFVADEPPLVAVAGQKWTVVVGGPLVCAVGRGEGRFEVVARDELLVAPLAFVQRQGSRAQ